MVAALQPGAAWPSGQPAVPRALPRVTWTSGCCGGDEEMGSFHHPLPPAIRVGPGANKEEMSLPVILNPGK